MVPEQCSNQFKFQPLCLRRRLFEVGADLKVLFKTFVASNRVTSKMDVAKSSIDLTAAVINAANTSNPIANLAIHVGQWLGREGVNSVQLGDCLSKAKALAYPNATGQEFCDKVKEDTIEKPISYILLIQSESLGRKIVRDPRLYWIASSAAALFQFHKDPNFVSNALCAFVLQHYYRDESEPFKSIDTTHKPERTTTAYVMEKIVSSVWLNIVNAGHATVALPEELTRICPRKGHLLKSEDFGHAIYTILQCKQRVLICSDHFFADLTLWLILHHEGTLRVVVSGKILFERRSGSAEKEVEIRVAQFCSLGPSCQVKEICDFQIFEDLGGRQPQRHARIYNEETLPRSSIPGVRQALYSVPKSYSHDNRASKRSSQILIQATAKKVVREILDVPLEVPEESLSLVFLASPGKASSPSDITILKILHRVPQIVNMRWENAKIKSPCIRSADDYEIPEDEMSSGTDTSEEGSVAAARKASRARRTANGWELEDLLAYFPVFQDLLFEIKGQCHCAECQGDPLAENISLRRGCLRTTALREALVLVSHSIADGFGCDDVSSTGDTDTLIKSVTVLLIKLCGNREVNWNDWFSSAACAYLGCPFKPSPRLEGASTDAAIQYGNLSVIAAWLDLNKMLKLQHCFGLIQGKGTIAVLKGSEDESAMRIQSVEETFAIIQTGQTEDISSYTDRYEKQCLPKGSLASLDKDQAKIKCDMILVAAGSNVYRFLLRVISQNHSRVVDASSAIATCVRLSCQDYPKRDCKHTKLIDRGEACLLQESYMYTTDEIIGRWRKHPPPQYPEGDFGMKPDDLREREESPNASTYSLHLSQTLDSNLKVNIALALAVDDAVIFNDGTWCLACVQAEMRLLRPLFTWSRARNREQIPKTRTVINAHPDLIQRLLTTDTKRKAIHLGLVKRSSSSTDTSYFDDKVLERFFLWEVESQGERKDRAEKWKRVRDIVFEKEWSVADLESMADGEGNEYNAALEANIPEQVAKRFKYELNRYKRFHKEE
ncbi:MAG: hypothetical protein M1822_008004 [Bathelium mastoideum]|nr:MAG: hypothetical protein M1822_008004 [Bathelium mastoideum]